MIGECSLEKSIKAKRSRGGAIDDWSVKEVCEATSKKMSLS
jgi:hypothetical protein